MLNCRVANAFDQADPMDTDAIIATVQEKCLK
jgi:hypothetical protein